MDSFEADKRQQLDRAIMNIREKFLLNIDDRIALFDDLLAQIETGEDMEDALKQISANAHKISGVARTLGFADLGLMTSKIETDFGKALAGTLSENTVSPLISQVEEMLDHLVSLSSGNRA